MFPKDKAGFEIDDQYYIGSSGLLVKPVTEKDAREAKVYLAEDQVCLILSVNSASPPRPFLLT
jgi:alpha 1,3-glucosidase